MPGLQQIFTRRRVLNTGAILVTLMCARQTEAPGQRAEQKTLRIGTSSYLASATNEPKEKSAVTSLKNMIREEIGLRSQVVRAHGWAALADQMSTGKVEIGIFQGYEFAWAREKFPELKPLALAVNGHRLLVAHLVVRHDSQAAD